MTAPVITVAHGQVMEARSALEELVMEVSERYAEEHVPPELSSVLDIINSVIDDLS